MRLDNHGNSIYQDKDVIDLIYKDLSNSLSQITLDQSPELEKLKNLAEINLNFYQQNNLSNEQFDKVCQEHWFMPKEYLDMDIEGFLVNQCPKENYQRLIEELQEFRARNMLPLLRLLKYIVDTLRANNIVWGVGRGSSVASYVLFLLGVHKVDSLKYQLDWREFLR